MTDRDPGRVYDDEEVDEIFSLAAQLEGTAALTTHGRDGLTLGELQAVGREVGLAPERVAEAAARLDAGGGTHALRRSLGAPVEVGRTVELSRELIDREWETLAAELRETFGSAGRVSSRRSAHEWTDGEIHAFLEPIGGGHRLRLSARTTPVTVLSVVGIFGLVVGLLLLVTSGLDEATFGPFFELVLPLTLALVGGGAAGLNALRLRQWAADRGRRLDHVADRALELSADPHSDPSD